MGVVCCNFNKINQSQYFRLTLILKRVMAFNKDELTPPNWMDDDFLLKVLKHSENDETINIEEFVITPGSNVGDHFASIMFRAKIKYIGKDGNCEKSILIKTTPVEEGLKKDLLDFDLFATEIQMYSDVVPKMEKLLKSVGEDFQMGPKLLYHSSNPYILVFEDLKELDFTMKVKQLNYEEALLIYGRLAKWHAAVYHIQDEIKCDIFYNNMLFSEKRRKFFPMWSRNFTMLSEIVADWPGYEKCAEKISNLKDSIFDKIVKLCETNVDNPYNLLVHGDFHVKNMMFKLDDNDKIKEFIFLDYQICAFSSAAYDIIYSLYSAIDTPTREAHRDDLIKHYHQNFLDMLKKFGYSKKIPNLFELQLECFKFGFLEVLLSAVFLPFMMIDFANLPKDGDQEVDLTDPNNWEFLLRPCYENPDYVKIMKQLLVAFDNKGFLDT